MTETQTPVVWLGVLALVVPWRRVWPSPEARLLVSCLALFALGLWAEYLIYGVFDAWWYLRFLLPTFPLVFIALGQLASRVSDRPWRRVVLTLAIVALGIHGFTFARDHHAFDLRQGNSQYVTAARVAQAVTEPTSVILSRQHSGSLRHYAGRMTMRYDLLGPGWLDEAVSWLSGRGVHVYALLDEFEVQAWRERFAGQRLGALDFRALREFEGSSGMMFYDLTAPGVKPSRRVATSLRDLDCHPPAPMAPFPLANRSR